MKRNQLVARLWIVGVAAVFAIAMASVIRPAQAVNPRAADPSVSTPAAPGETLVVEGGEYRSAALEFKKEVQWGRTSGSIERAAGQWAIVHLEVTNRTDRFQRIPWQRIAVRDLTGTHRLNDSLSRLLSRGSGLGSIDDTIAPSARLTTLLVFDVPTTRELTLEIRGRLLRLN